MRFVRRSNWLAQILIVNLGGRSLTRLFIHPHSIVAALTHELTLFHLCQFRCMAAFPRSAHALKRVVVGLESELAPILSLGMAAGDV